MLSWGLSFYLARESFGATKIVTDRPGAEFLVNGLGLAFDEVDMALDALKTEDPRWWVLGKLVTYSRQREPFVHIDGDVYLWEPLPTRILTADVIGQNLEVFSFGRDPWYRPDLLSRVVRRAGGWMPREWEWYVSQQGDTAVCCGIFGGNALEFIGNYSETAINFALKPRNRLAWNEIPDLENQNVLLEQYLLSAMLRFRDKRRSESNSIQLECLFDTAWFSGIAPGYTHLMGSLKTDRRSTSDLVDIVSSTYPEFFARCKDYASSF